MPPSFNHSTTDEQMLITPNNSPRVALSSKTNTLNTSGHQSNHVGLQAKPIAFLPTPPTEKLSKRRISADENFCTKRLKLNIKRDTDSDSDTSEEDEQYIDANFAPIQSHVRSNAAQDFHKSFIMRTVTSCRRFAPSTTPILRSFVSSHKADTFKCHSTGVDAYLTPPYACSYTHAAKTGGVQHLAVATEQGTVHILDTSKRRDWDLEPSRVSYQAHNNGIFDIKWNLDDTSLATCSGDQSVRITDVRASKITHVLHGHNSTVKCVAWHSTNPSLLATGGRDGAISLWDLRIANDKQQDDICVSRPVITIHGAHEDASNKKKGKQRKGKNQHAPRTVTSILYPDSEPHGLISSGSYDGVLRFWDLRKSLSGNKGKSTKPTVPSGLYSSPIDPATSHGSKRPRGIINMAGGFGPSSGLIFAVGTDSRIYTYDIPTLTAQKSVYSHNNLQTSSFYIGLAVSPCGRWLGCGGSAKRRNSFLFDVENAGRPGFMPSPGIEFQGQGGDVGAVDWAQDALATCLDDGVVRIWRPDVGTYSRCLESPEESKWNWLWST